MKSHIKNYIAGVFIHLEKISHIIQRDKLPVFANAQKNLRIDLPRRVTHSENITIGNDVHLGPGTQLVITKQYPGKKMRHPEFIHKIQQFDPKIIIGDRVTSTSNLQLFALQKIKIEDDVMFATNVFVCDGFHGFSNVDQPFKYQPMERISPISIGKGSWIGQNVVINPGVTIGEMSVIGANSVVTRSIPDRCIAVGNPARVIKQWNDNLNSWGKVKYSK